MGQLFYYLFLSFFLCSFSTFAGSVENLLDAYNDLSYGPLSMDSMYKLITETEKIENKEDYPLLMQHYNKARNYFYASHRLDNCTLDEGRNLGQRYLNQMGHVGISCSSNIHFLDSNLDQFFEDMDDISSSVIQKDIHLDFIDKLADQAVLSLIDHRRRYGITTPLPSAEELCAIGSISRHEPCSKDYSLKLQEKLDYYKSTIKPDFISDEIDVANNINALIDALNRDPEKYKNELLSAPGTLLFSDTLQDRVGGLENLGQKKLRHIGRQNVQDALNEVDSSYINMIKDLGRKSMYKTDDAINKSVKQILKSSPHLVGSELSTKPEYSNKICALLGEIENDDDDSESFYKWGGLIVGGVLVVGTVLTFGGVGVLVAAGGATAMSAGLFTAGTITLTAGGMTAGGLATKNAIEKYNDIKSFEEAIYVSAADDDTIDEINSDLKEFYSLRTQAILEFGGSVLGVGVLKQLTKLSELKEFNKLMKAALADSKILAKLKEINKKYGPWAVTKLLFHAIKMPFKAAFDYLAKIQIKKMPRWMWVHSKKFVRSVKSVPRFFVKKRSAPAETKWEATKQFFLNPLGKTSGIILRKSELRNHITLPIAIISGMALGMKVDGDLVVKQKRKAKVRTNTTAGSAYLSYFTKVLGLDPAASAIKIIEHDQQLVAWKKDPTKNRLPRIQWMIDNNILTSKEAKSLDGLAKRAYEKAMIEYESYIINNPDVTVTDYLHYTVYDLINKTPKFQNLPEFKKNLLVQYFDPIVDLGSRNDIELSLKINELSQTSSQSIDTDEDLQKLATNIILNLTNKGNYSSKEAMVMVNDLLDNPERTRKKFEKMKTILPPEKGYIGLVPDAPREDAIGILQRPNKIIEDELDLYDIIVNDKRFTQLKDAWYNDTINDLEAKNYAEDMIDDYNELELLNKLWEEEDREPNETEIGYLYSLNGTGKAPNQLLEFSSLMIEGLDWGEFDEEEGISDKVKKKVKSCLTTSTKYWAGFFSKEADIARDEEFEEKRTKLAEEYHTNFNTILEKCTND